MLLDVVVVVLLDVVVVLLLDVFVFLWWPPEEDLVFEAGVVAVGVVVCVLCLGGLDFGLGGGLGLGLSFIAGGAWTETNPTTLSGVGRTLTAVT